ncbi:MAG: hypothetical protein KFKLKKLM_00356 [Flavobacteriales bacterium]|nr:hypothetical protein [Flavobacteriales bacterium]
MRLTEKILITLAVIIAVLKFIFIPGSGVFMVFVFCLLSSLYFYFGFALFNNIRLRHIFKKDSYANVSKSRIIGGIALGLSLSFAVIGFLFKAQRWPGTSFHLIISIISGVIILIISLIKFFKTKANYYKNALIRIVISTSISILILVIPNLTFVKIRFRNHPKYIEVYERYIKDPSNIDLSNELWLEYKRATLDDVEFKQFLEFEYEELKQQDN